MSTADSNPKDEATEKKDSYAALYLIGGLILIFAFLFAMVSIYSQLEARDAKWTGNAATPEEARSLISQAQERFLEANGEYTDDLPLNGEEHEGLSTLDPDNGLGELYSNGKVWCATILKKETNSRAESFTVNSADDEIRSFGPDSSRAEKHCDSIVFG